MKWLLEWGYLILVIAVFVGIAARLMRNRLVPAQAWLAYSKLEQDTTETLYRARVEPAFRPWRLVMGRENRLASVSGGGGVGGSPETYQLLSASPDGLRLAACSTEVPSGALDLNIQVFDLLTGTAIGRFNEHSVGPLLSRASCRSPVFERLLQALAASGEPPERLASYDYTVDVESSNIALTRLAWSANGHLLVTFRFNVVVAMGGLGPSGSDDFTVEVDFVPGRSSPVFLSFNAGIPEAAPPVGTYAFEVGTGADAGRILVNGARLEVAAWEMALGHAAPVGVTHVAGNIP